LAPVKIALNDKRPTQYELESRWITSEGIPGVSYHYSDLCRIKSGEHAGQTAEVIALLSIDPQPRYGLVLPLDEKFVVLPQNDLESTGLSAGGRLVLHKPGENPRGFNGSDEKNTEPRKT
jgi:hypothetical protein